MTGAIYNNVSLHAGRKASRRVTRLLAGTAVAAMGLLSLSHPAMAVGDQEVPMGGNVVSGKGSITNPAAGREEVHQASKTAYYTWNSFSVGKDGSIEYFTPGPGALSVNKVLGHYRSDIYGSIKSNGRFVLLNQNGVFVGNGANINAPAVLLSTAKDFKVSHGGRDIALSDLGTDGAVVNDGTVTAAQSGLVAFVAPNVANNGIINAKLGRVALAAGTQSATVDLYGDGLVELAPGGDSGKVLASNAGQINAGGGIVAMTAAAAKDAVDNVISMDGVINASSFQQKGGAIVLSGGDNGNVAVSGTLAADGKNGGRVTVTGKDITMADGATVRASAVKNGNGGVVTIKGKGTTDFRGTVIAEGGAKSGNGGKVEISGNILGYTGLVDTRAPNGKTGSLLLDPADMVIGNDQGTEPGQLDQPYVNAQDIANTLGYTDVDLQADHSITVTDDIDISTYYNFDFPIFDLARTGFAAKTDDELPPVFPPFPGFGIGITTGNLTMTAPTVNIDHDIILGEGNLSVDSHSDAGDGVLNLNGKIYSRDYGDIFTFNNIGEIPGLSSFTDPALVTDASRLDANGTVNVKSNAALIMQGLGFVESGHTVNVAAGTYDEDVVMNDADVTLAGTAATVTPHSPGIVVNSNGDTVTGMTVDGGSVGIMVQNANNVTVSNNTVKNTTGNGIYFLNSDMGKVTGNKVSNTGATGHGIAFEQGSDGATISGNTVNHTGYNGIYTTGGTNETISGNTVIGSSYSTDINAPNPVFAHGISIENGSGSITGNTVKNGGGDGILVYNSTGPVSVLDNDVSVVRRYGIGSIGSSNVTIGSEVANNSSIFSNSVSSAGYGVYVNGGTNVFVDKNTITNTYNTALYATNANGTSDTAHGVKFFRNYVRGGNTGVDITSSAYASVTNNRIFDMTGEGVTLDRDAHLQVNGNRVYSTGGDGIHITRSADATVDYNYVYKTGSNAIEIANKSNGSNVIGNEIGADNNGVVQGTGNVKGDGVLLDSSDNVVIQGNRVRQTASTGNDIGTGIRVNNARNVTIGGTGTGQANNVSASGWDNIKLTGTTNGTVQGNILSGPARTNIYTENTVGTHILSNSATGAKLNGHGAVWANGDMNDVIDNNTIANGVTYGIQVTNATGFTTVSRNAIDHVSSDGIHADTASRIGIGSNLIGLSGAGSIGGSGIYATNLTGNSSANNNVIRNVGATGIFVAHAGLPLAGHTNSMQVNGNKIGNTGSDGIHADTVTNLQVANNTIGGSAVGGAIGNDGIGVMDSPGAAVSGNVVTDTKNDGIFVDPSPNSTVTGNQVSNAGNNGIEVLDSDNVQIGGAVAGAGNIVTNAANNGILIANANGTTVTGNIVTGSGADGLFASGGEIGNIALAGNSFTNNPTGAKFESGTIDLTGATNSFTGGNVGLLFAPAPVFVNIPFPPEFPGEGQRFLANFIVPAGNAPMSLVNDTIGTSTFTGQSTYYVQLANGAFFLPGAPTKLDGDHASYDGIVPVNQPGGGLSVAQDAAINAKIFDYRDDQTLGLFFNQPNGGPGGPGGNGGGTPPATSGAGGGAGTFEFGEEDIFHYFGGFDPPTGPLRVTITGLPYTGTPRFNAPGNPNSLAGITPGAGGPDNVADIAPGAGGADAGNAPARNCWTDAVASAGQGRPVSVNFGTGLNQTLSDIASCRGTL